MLPPSRPKCAVAPGSASKAGSPSSAPCGSWANSTGDGIGRGVAVPAGVVVACGLCALSLQAMASATSTNTPIATRRRRIASTRTSVLSGNAIRIIHGRCGEDNVAPPCVSSFIEAAGECCYGRLAGAESRPPTEIPACRSPRRAAATTSRTARAPVRSRYSRIFFGAPPEDRRKLCTNRRLYLPSATSSIKQRSGRESDCSTRCARSA